MTIGDGVGTPIHKTFKLPPIHTPVGIFVLNLILATLLPTRTKYDGRLCYHRRLSVNMGGPLARSQWGGRYPSQVQLQTGGGTLTRSMSRRGATPARYPIQVQTAVYPGWGTPPARSGWGNSHLDLDLGWGTTPSGDSDLG